MIRLRKDSATIVARALGCLLLCALAGRPSAAQSEGELDRRPFPVGQTVERQLDAGETHYYDLNLEAGASFRLDLTEKGINCVAAIVSQGGDPPAGLAVNFGLGFDRETFTYIAREGGAHLVAVAGRGSRRGAYSLTGRIDTNAGADERRRAEASRALAEGVKLWLEARRAGGMGEVIRMLEGALSLWKELGEDYWVGYASNALGRIHTGLSEKQKAMDYLSAALEVARKLGDKRAQALANNNLAIVHAEFGEFEAAHKLFQTSLTLREEIGDEAGRANVLTAIGAVHGQMGSQSEALTHYEKALPILRGLKDADGEANTLSSIGTLHIQTGDLPKALDSLTQALALLKETNDASLKSRVLHELAAVHSSLSDFPKALDYYQQSLGISEAIGERQRVARAYENIGGVYFQLGELRQASECAEKALAISREIGDDEGVASALNALSTLYSAVGDERRMLETLAASSAMLLEKKGSIRPQLRAALLIRAGNFFYERNVSNETAANLLREAVEIVRAIQDKGMEAQALNSLGHVYRELGDERKSLGTFYQSFLAAAQVGDSDSEATVLSNLMEAWHLSGNPRLATFYGKEAVNKYQQLRTHIRGLDRETQKSYLRRRADAYVDLARLLLEQGRYAEALQVVNASQDQQFYDFNRDRDTPAVEISLTPREAAFASEHRRTGERFVVVARRLEDFQRRAGERRTPEEKQQLADLVEQTTAASEELIAAFTRAAEDFSRPPRADGEASRVAELAEMQTVLRELSAATSQKTVALYTLAGENGFRVLLVTPDSVFSAASSLTSRQLDGKVLQYYALLQTPDLDPRPLGKELYDTIVGPIEPQLRAAGAQTLLWSPGGTLRYVPMASLWDGKKYLAERYRHVVFTRADRERMTRAVSLNWTGVGFGTSRAHTVEPVVGGNPVSFVALPGVLEELRAIFRTTENGGGVVRGQALADERFTRDAFLDALKRRHPLVHVASHFSFRPGDDTQSFLLLGDGSTLTLNEMKRQGRLFEGVELLTLSACDTAATRADAMGREIDGFAESAQRLGAGAVLATLWTVADNSTPLLMREFYRARQGGRSTKAEALRTAQLALLGGARGDGALPSGRAGAPPAVKVELVDTLDKKPAVRAYGRGAEIVYVEKAKAPAFDADRDKPYAHPYYWAPFVLIGNGN